ncbi:Transmembrane protein [Toxocara canis]|uniref:Transmembrane protein n=1 Tax=Toxocara canis TaxID=6265 RepID=A0A0B2W376_TOXCA|nr:Transmembrane protein [Toxocara canis]
MFKFSKHRSIFRFEYKKDYEKFKLRVTSIILAVLAIAFVFPSRPIDAICNFLLVWYYCTLTIRESILRINGSNINITIGGHCILLNEMRVKACRNICAPKIVIQSMKAVTDAFCQSVWNKNFVCSRSYSRRTLPLFSRFNINTRADVYGA